MVPLWMFAVYYAYGIPMLIIYCVIVYVLIAKKQLFPSTFYNFVAVFGIQDIFCYLLAQYVQRAPICDYFFNIFFYQFVDTPSKLHIFTLFGLFATELNGCLATLILASNRITCVIYPLDHERIWRKYFYITLGIYYLTPFVFYWFLFFNNGIIICEYDENHEPSGCSFNYDHSNTFGGLSMTKINVVLYTVIPVLAGVLNTIAIVFICARRKSFRRSKAFTQEINLSLSSIAILASHMLYGSLYVFGPPYLYHKEFKVVSYLMSVVVPLIYDAVMLCTISSLLIASKQLRYQVTGVLFGSLCDAKLNFHPAVKVTSSVGR